MKFCQIIITSSIILAGTTPAFAQFNLPNLPLANLMERDKLTAVEISAVVLAADGDIDKCRAEHKKKEPKVSGELLAHFTVEPNGKASRLTIASSQFSGSTFAQCLANLVNTWNFPKSKERSSAFNLAQKF